jgi:hypothetical protein
MGNKKMEMGKDWNRHKFYLEIPANNNGKKYP